MADDVCQMIGSRPDTLSATNSLTVLPRPSQMNRLVGNILTVSGPNIRFEWRLRHPSSVCTINNKACHLACIASSG